MLGRWQAHRWPDKLGCRREVETVLAAFIVSGGAGCGDEGEMALLTVEAIEMVCFGGN